MTSAALGVLLALGALGGACSSSSGSPRDAGCKPSNVPGECAWTPCQNSVADVCAAAATSNNPCVMDWPADPASFCPAYAAATGDSLSISDCGSYRAVQANGVDGGGTDYYDKATGKLVAMVGYNANFGTTRCSGGPSNFVPPTCGSPQSVSCPDAGDVGGTGGAGGMGGGADASP